jgi:hypothetical protein
MIPLRRYELIPARGCVQLRECINRKLELQQDPKKVAIALDAGELRVVAAREVVAVRQRKRIENSTQVQSDSTTRLASYQRDEDHDAHLDPTAKKKRPRSRKQSPE